MIYLITQLAGWLLLTAAFAALAGWAVAAQRAAAGDETLLRDRDHLVRDIVALASGESGAANESVGAEREVDVARRMGEIHISRIAELERQLSAARSSADSAAAQAAELQRALEARDVEPAAAAVVEPGPADTSAEDEAVALQAWRLRYFEQRVRYLEGAARAPARVEDAPPLDQWRARVAQAEAAHLADEMRAGAEPQAPDAEGASPFAANADVDVLLRWRMLYLERRVAHLQARAAAAAPAPMPAEVTYPAGPDPDRWKWRARYLEARTRHLEQRAVAAPAPVTSLAPEPEAAPEAPPRPSVPSAKPMMLASARNGAPDDLTLIDGVSLQQQSTFYSLGVFHFDQIAAWTPENVAWVDQYLRLRGRIEDEEWIEQAADLAREGPAAARRVLEDEDF
jgi:predicted flap endonuclease-1-like 5' DNA nuclease